MTFVLNLICSLFLCVSNLKVTFRILKHHKDTHVGTQNANQGIYLPINQLAHYQWQTLGSCLFVVCAVVPSKPKVYTVGGVKGVNFQSIISTDNIFCNAFLSHGTSASVLLHGCQISIPSLNKSAKKACGSPECSSQSHFYQKTILLLLV